MFYKEFITLLKTTQSIADSVGTYENEPAIFSEHAPEKATEEGGPAYIVIRIETSPETDRVISVSNLFIDYFDYNKSRVICNQYALDVMDLLDNTRQVTKQSNDLRVTLLSDGYVEETDTRTIHFNSTFSCRGARSRWMSETK